MGGFAAPVPIDPATQGCQPTQGFGGQYGYDWPFVSGPFSYSGNLYVVLGNQNVSAVDVWKSSDAGMTWVKLDYTHAPSGSFYTFQSAFDGHSLFVVLSYPVYGIVFDLATETWGGSYPLSDAWYSNCVLARGVGDFIALCSVAQAFATPYTAYYMSSFVFSGGGWSAGTDVTSGALALKPTGGCGYVSGCVGANGTTYFFYAWSDGNTFHNTFCQELLAGGGLGTNTQLVEHGPTYVLSLPAAVGNLAVFPVYETIGGISVLSLYTGPSFLTWKFISNIDPGYGIKNIPSASYDGTTLRIVYSPDGRMYRLLSTTDFVTFAFTGVTLFDPSIDAIPSGFAPSPPFEYSTGLWNSQGLEFNASILPGVTQSFFMPFGSPTPSLIGCRYQVN